MTYLDIDCLLLVKPETTLAIVGETHEHVDILARRVRENLMLAVDRMRPYDLRLKNGAYIMFVSSAQLDQKIRGSSNVKVVFGDNIKDE